MRPKQSGDAGGIASRELILCGTGFGGLRRVDACVVLAGKLEREGNSSSLVTFISISCAVELELSASCSTLPSSILELLPVLLLLLSFGAFLSSSPPKICRRKTSLVDVYHGGDGGHLKVVVG